MTSSWTLAPGLMRTLAAVLLILGTTASALMARRTEDEWAERAGPGPTTCRRPSARAAR